MELASRKRRGKGRLSIVAQGARRQFTIALALLTFIPILSFAFITLTLLWPTPGTYSHTSRVLVASLAMVLALCGYSLLAKYPRNIEKLRTYLAAIAEGRIPETIDLPDVEEDLRAIQSSLAAIVAELRSQVRQLQNQLALAKKMQKTIQEQAEELLAAERQRVMIESLATACHHVAQPAAVLRMNLDALRRSELAESAQKKIEACSEAMTSLGDVIDKLRHVHQYRTVPYRTYRSEAGEEIPDQRILDLSEASGVPRPSTEEQTREGRAT